MRKNWSYFKIRLNLCQFLKRNLKIRIRKTLIIIKRKFIKRRIKELRLINLGILRKIWLGKFLRSKIDGKIFLLKFRNFGISKKNFKLEKSFKRKICLDLILIRRD